MSTRETILAAVAACLVSAGVASGRVYRSRREQLGTLPAVIVEPSGASSAENVLTVVDHELTVAVSVYAKGDTPDSAADATMSAVHSALMGNPTLGITGVILLPEFTYEPDLEDYDYARSVHRYRIQYRTASTLF